MVAIFGVRADFYSPSAFVEPNINPSIPSHRKVDRGAREWKKRSRNKRGGNDEVIQAGKGRRRESDFPSRGGEIYPLASGSREAGR